jgi:hypothetical protein
MVSTNPYVVAGSTDDPKFIALLNSLLQRLIVHDPPLEVFVVQIDNWFDHKWLKFSGIGSVDYRFPAYMNRIDSAKQEVWQDKTTLPPFAPHRVLSQRYFRWLNSEYTEAVPTSFPHGSDRRPSRSNLQSRVEDRFDSACFIWYSANTLVNGKASVMVYTVAKREVLSWFASFNRQDEWHLQLTKGTNREEVLRLIAPEAL